VISSYFEGSCIAHVTDSVRIIHKCWQVECKFENKALSTVHSQQLISFLLVKGKVVPLLN
jgi:hypothetical protein